MAQWALVVAQLSEWSLSTPEDRSSSLVIGDFLNSIYLFIVNCIENIKINKKRPRMAHLKNPMAL